MFKSRRLKSVSNAIKSASSSDISAGLNSKLFDVREVSRYGMNGTVKTFAFDPVQSLLAIATDAGEIHVYGKQQVEVVFTLDSKAVVKELRFVKGIYLIAVDSKDSILVLSLYSKKVLTAFFAPGKITCVETDPSLEWMLIGLQSGTTVIYDIDKDCISPLRIENIQKSLIPKEQLSHVVSIQWNPRDYGTVLISYRLVTVIYSLVENKVRQQFHYEVPPYAPGGDQSGNLEAIRTPEVVQSIYHPNSLHILTVHRDNTLVFWDANSGKLIQARSLFETDVNVPRKMLDPPPLVSSPIFQVSWICAANPEYTSLLIAGGSGGEEKQCHSLIMMDLGATPMYSVTSYEKMSAFYAAPHQQKVFPVPNEASVVRFLPLARKSCHFAGNHDPAVVLVLLDDGEIETILYPSGSVSYKASLFPQSISWVRPAATKCVATSVPKKLWLGMMSSTYSRDYLLKGGAPVKKPLRVHDTRSALATGHKNGSVRIWDASHGELDDSSVFDVSVSQALNKSFGVGVDNVSFASETAELAVSIEDGDVVLFKFQANQYFGSAESSNDTEIKFRRFSLNETKDLIVDISDRAPRKLREGFMPVCAIHASSGRVTALKNSNIGFVGIAYEDGTFMVIDRRGPAMIYSENVRKVTHEKSTNVTCIDFSIAEYGEDRYSSILIACGTDVGESLIFKILPDSSGRFMVQYIDALRTNDQGPIMAIESTSKETGASCSATITSMQGLSKGLAVPAFTMVSGYNDIRLFTAGKSKDTHKVFKYPIATAGQCYIRVPDGSKIGKPFATVLVCLLVNGEIKVLTVPELRELHSTRLPMPVQSKYIKESSVLRNGDIVVRVGKCEASLLTILKETASHMEQSHLESIRSATDSLYNPALRIECRPQVNTLQWARGSIYVKRSDLDNLLGTAHKPFKYEESDIANGTISHDPQETVANAHQLDSGAAEHSYVAPVRHTARSEGVGAMRSLSRAMENGMDTLEGRLNDYATVAGETINGAVEQTSSDLMKGVFRSKMGL
ncbi:LANO_0F12640g1_1 [Lachancea nothofagi CBS 11611]|uniref:LANO_0F12640g1_1 n=1 Tax=Lachancea nothofagi CBS 11611 TaxID=1266666 RepID=A0A1G4KBE6_9SACH|nr:LANO_0F12640g1_1 [Lachancea nothofagi CBS 11611]